MFSSPFGRDRDILPGPNANQSILVIGAGVAGLQVLKRLRELGRQVLALESKPDVGGVWKQNYVGYTLQVPWRMYQFPDFLWPKNLQPSEEYPTGQQVHEYVRAYASHFNLTQHIRFNCKLLRLRWKPVERSWQALYFDASKDRFFKVTANFVVMCTGMYSNPYIPTYKNSEAFAGLQVHAMDFTDLSPARGRRVIVVGAGKTALDCATRVAATGCAASVTLLHRQAHWPMPQRLLGIPIRQLLFSRVSAKMLPPYYTAGRSEWAVHSATKPLKRLFWKGIEAAIGSRFNLLKKLRPNVSLPMDLLYGGQILDDSVDEQLENGRTTVLRGEIQCFLRNGVVLQDGTFRPADVVLYCTGYVKSYGCFDSATRDALGVQKDGLYLYRNCLPCNVPHVAFVGSEVSTYNNILTHSLQALWLAHVLTGAIKLPGRNAMAADMRAQQQWRRQVMPPQRSRGSVLMLYGMHYHDQLLEDMGQKQRRRRLNPFSRWFGSCWPEDYVGAVAGRDLDAFALAQRASERFPSELVQPLQPWLPSQPPLSVKGQVVSRTASVPALPREEMEGVQTLGNPAGRRKNRAMYGTRGLGTDGRAQGSVGPTQGQQMDEGAAAGRGDDNGGRRVTFRVLAPRSHSWSITAAVPGGSGGRDAAPPLISGGQPQQAAAASGRDGADPLGQQRQCRGALIRLDSQMESRSAQSEDHLVVIPSGDLQVAGAAAEAAAEATPTPAVTAPAAASTAAEPVVATAASVAAAVAAAGSEPAVAAAAAGILAPATEVPTAAAAAAGMRSSPSDDAAAIRTHLDCAEASRSNAAATTTTASLTHGSMSPTISSNPRGLIRSPTLPPVPRPTPATIALDACLQGRAIAGAVTAAAEADSPRGPAVPVVAVPTHSASLLITTSAEPAIGSLGGRQQLDDQQATEAVWRRPGPSGALTAVGQSAMSQQWGRHAALYPHRCGSSRSFTQLSHVMFGAEKVAVYARYNSAAASAGTRGAAAAATTAVTTAAAAGTSDSIGDDDGDNDGGRDDRGHAGCIRTQEPVVTISIDPVSAAGCCAHEPWRRGSPARRCC